MVTPGPNSRFASRRREDLGTTGRDLAAAIGGYDRTTLAHYFAGRRTLPADVRDRLDIVIALGSRGDKRWPVLALATVDEEGITEPVIDESIRIAYFDWQSREFARDFAATLRAAGWLDLEAVPAWPSWLTGFDAEPIHLSEQFHAASRGRSRGKQADDALVEILTFVASARRLNGTSDSESAKATRRPAVT